MYLTEKEENIPEWKQAAEEKKQKLTEEKLQEVSKPRGKYMYTILTNGRRRAKRSLMS